LRILGIDPGTARCGWGVMDVSKKNGDIAYVKHGCIVTDKFQTDADRLKRLFHEILFLLEEYKPDQVSLELLFMFHNQKTVMKIAEARGVILLACAQKDLALQTFEYTPMQVKMAVTGYGRSDKKKVVEEVQNWLQSSCHVSFSKKDGFDDAADALAVALAHYHKYIENSMDK
jgi:crossover junction endodeoxyribonuclease RuvC